MPVRNSRPSTVPIGLPDAEGIADGAGGPLGGDGRGRDAEATALPAGRGGDDTAPDCEAAGLEALSPTCPWSGEGDSGRTVGASTTVGSGAAGGGPEGAGGTSGVSWTGGSETCVAGVEALGGGASGGASGGGCGPSTASVRAGP